MDDEKQMNDINRTLQGICDLPPTLFTRPEDAWRYQMVLATIAGRGKDWIDLDEFVGTSGMNPEMVPNLVWWLTIYGFLEIAASQTHPDDGWLIRIHPQLLAYIEAGAPAEDAQTYGLGARIEEAEEDCRPPVWSPQMPMAQIYTQVLNLLDGVGDAEERERMLAIFNELGEMADEYPDSLSLFEIIDRLREPYRTHFLKLGAALMRWTLEKQYGNTGHNA
jgi:hypothetical protein